MLRWRLLLEEYGPAIEYIKDKKHIAAYVISKLPNNSNQETTHEQTYTMETMSKINDNKYLPEGTFPLFFNVIDRHQQEDPSLTENLKCA